MERERRRVERERRRRRWGREKVLQTLLTCVRDCTTILEYLDTGTSTEYTFRDLGLTECDVNEAVCQFWGGATGWIMEVWNNTRRGKQTPVPDYLLPNDETLGDLRRRLQCVAE